MAGSSGESYRDAAARWMHMGKRNGWTVEQVIEAVRQSYEVRRGAIGSYRASEPVCEIIRAKYDTYKPRMTFYEKQMAQSQV